MAKIIVHNSVSLDGAFTGFPVDMGIHYQLAGNYKAQAHLTGSGTALAGIKMFIEKVPKETKDDFLPPKGLDDKPFLLLVDSRGKMKGLLHVVRKSGYFRDVVVLVSKKTPKPYLRYLGERNYRQIPAGKDRVDLAEGLAKSGFAAILVDSGPSLVNALLKANLVDELSLLVHPLLVGGGQKLLDTAKPLVLKSCEQLGKGFVHLVYEVGKG